MSGFATGRRSVAICDRCAEKIPYLSLVTEWTGLRVCPECWEQKHPQLTNHAIVDETALWQPRPGENRREDAAPRMLSGFTIHADVGTVTLTIT